MKAFKVVKEYLKNNLSESWLDKAKFLREVLLFLPNYISDAYRYARYSATRLDVKNKSKLRAMLIKNFHIVEKACRYLPPGLVLDE